MTFPRLLSIRISSVETSNPVVVEAVLDAAEEAGVVLRGGGPWEAERPDTLERHAILSQSVTHTWSAALLLFYGEDLGLMIHGPRGKTRKISTDWPCKTEAEARARLPQVVALVQGIAARVVVEGTLSRGGIAPRVGPLPPLVDLGSHALVVDPDRISEAYESPSAFYRAGWSTAADVAGGRKLLVRAVDGVTNAQFLERTLEPSWEQTRAARPLRTRYQLPAPADDEERAIYRAGSPRVFGDTYDPGRRVYSRTCAARPHEHLRGWEIDDLHAIVRARALTDGRPVDEVHVYFHLEATARTERRPLLDGGVRVYFLGPGAELVEVVD